MKVKIMRIEKDIAEEDFPKYLKELDYTSRKIRTSNHKAIEKKLGVKFKIGKGMPDFLVCHNKNKGDRFLCEFKSLNDGWRANQIQWAIDNPNVPLTIAMVSPKKRRVDEIEIDSEYEEVITKSNKHWEIKNKMLNDYVHKHPELVGKTLFRDNRFIGEGYLGQIPEEVNKQWIEYENAIQ